MSRSIALSRARPGSPGAVRAVSVASAGAYRSARATLMAPMTRQPPCGCSPADPGDDDGSILNTVTITRPVEEILTYLADPENLPQWNYAIEQTRKISPGPVGVGTVYRQTRTLPGRSHEDFDIVVFSRPAGWRSTVLSGR